MRAAAHKRLCRRAAPRRRPVGGRRPLPRTALTVGRGRGGVARPETAGRARGKPQRPGLTREATGALRALGRVPQDHDTVVEVLPIPRPSVSSCEA